MKYLFKNFQSPKLPCVNVAAIVMLRVARSFSWTWDTVEEILTLGNRIYDENLPHVNGREIFPKDITERIRLGKSKFQIDAEQAVFGALCSTHPNLSDLYTALKNFFNFYDAGIVQGPQNVAVWHELGYFYMFDPKERDRCARKWVPEFANADVAAAEAETVGCACVTRYTQICQLVQVYSDTVPLKHRHDSFRITKIEVNDYRDKSDDWFEWKGIGINQWILRGHFSQANQRFSPDSRNCQATCISALSLAFQRFTPIEKWTSSTVDEILIAGDKFYKATVEDLKAKNQFIDSHLQVAELGKRFTCREQNISFNIDDCVVNGALITTSKESNLVDLESGRIKLEN